MKGVKNMAVQNFTEAMEYPQHMTIISPNGREYNGYYCDPKLDRRTLPNGWNAYDIRHDDDGCGLFVELCHNYVIVNNAGTFFFEGQIEELAEPDSVVDFKTECDEIAWNFTF
jgi:hypothetical protein